MNRLAISVGSDDGHDTIKTCTGYNKATGQYACFSVKSIALFGLHQIVSLNNESAAYATGEEQFTVSGENALGRHLDTRFLDYPKSSLNRVLVQHALVNAGMQGAKVSLVTGLPVDQFYQAGKTNDVLIAAKSENLLKSVKSLNQAVKPACVVRNQVISEGIAAIYDALINGDGSPNTDVEHLVSRRPVAVVDMGGKTLDIATISENAGGIYSDRSGTEEIGVIKLKEKVAALIKSTFKLNNEPPAKYIEEAFRTKQYEIFGQQEDVSAILETCCHEYAASVKNAFLKKVGDGSDLGAVFFVGGGAALLKIVLGEGIFGEIYRGKKIIPEAPEYANARGMWKAATYLFKVPNENDAQVAAA